MLTDRQLGICAYIVGEEIARRRRFGIPIPGPYRAVHSALLREVTRPRHDACETAHGAARLETAAELAQRLGVSKRTVQRLAAKEGTKMIGGMYVFGERNGYDD